MSQFQLFQDRQFHVWAVRQEGLWRLVRQHIYGRLRRESTRVRTAIAGTPTQTLETDFAAIRLRREWESAALMAELWRGLELDASGTFDRLVAMRRETVANEAWLDRQMEQVSRHNHAVVAQAVRTGNAGERLATQVLGTATEVLLLGVAALPAGAAAAGFLTLGTTLSGVHAYAETGNVGVAALTMTTNVVAGVTSLRFFENRATYGALGEGVAVFVGVVKDSGIAFAKKAAVDGPRSASAAEAAAEAALTAGMAPGRDRLKTAVKTVAGSLMGKACLRGFLGQVGAALADQAVQQTVQAAVPGGTTAAPTTGHGAQGLVDLAASGLQSPRCTGDGDNLQYYCAQAEGDPARYVRDHVLQRSHS